MKTLLLVKFQILILILTGYNLAFANEHDLQKQSIFKKTNEEKYFQLPEGISIIEKEQRAHYCTVVEHKIINGSNGFIKICSSFISSSEDNIQVTLPAGLIFLSENPDASPAVILQELNFEVEAFGTVHVEFYAYRYSPDRNQKVGDPSTYNFEMVSQNDGISAIAELVKELDFDYKKDSRVKENDRIWYLSVSLQNAVDDAVSDGILSDETKNILRDINDRDKNRSYNEGLINQYQDLNQDKL